MLTVKVSLLSTKVSPATFTTRATVVAVPVSVVVKGEPRVKPATGTPPIVTDEISAAVKKKPPVMVMDTVASPAVEPLRLMAKLNGVLPALPSGSETAAGLNEMVCDINISRRNG